MYQELEKSIREYKKPTFLTPVFVVGEVILEAFIPYVIALLVNEIKLGIEVSRILQYAVILIVLSLFSLLFGYLAGVNVAKASCGFAKNLRQDIFYRIQSFSFANIDRFSNASLITRLTTDIQNVQMSFTMLIRTAFHAPLNLLFSVFMAYHMAGAMAAIFLFVVPVLGVGLYFIAKIVLPMFQRGFPKYDDMNGKVEETIRGIRVVKSFVREEYEVQCFEKNNDEIRNIFEKADRIIALSNPLMQVCIYVVMLAVLRIGAERIISSNGTLLDIGQFSTLLTYSFQIMISLMMLAMVFVIFTFSRESAHRIAEVLQEYSTITSKENAICDVKNGSIDFNDVDFKYFEKAERMVLEKINLHIKSGETIGIIGSTGSGKSSLVQLIARLYDVSAGSVAVGGVDVREYNLESLRNEVAMVLQKNTLFSGTVLENIRWGNQDATEEEVREVCRMACADEFIMQMPMGYESRIEQGGSNVSGGQKQRLCIARALLKKPKILIMDDSTSAVDTKTDAKIQQAMREYLPETTKMIIAQRTSSVEYADRIIVMNDGKIDAVGTSDYLLEHNEIYRAIYMSQNKSDSTALKEMLV